MRKKIIALLLLSSALLSLCACKKGDGENAAESVYSDPTYFNGTTTVKVSDEAAVAALTSGEMEVQTSEDAPFVTIKLGTTAEKFTPLFPEGEMQYLERKGYAEYLPVGSQIFVSLDAPEEGAVAISQYGDVFQFSLIETVYYNFYVHAAFRRREQSADHVVAALVVIKGIRGKPYLALRAFDQPQTIQKRALIIVDTGNPLAVRRARFRSVSARFRAFSHQRRNVARKKNIKGEKTKHARCDFFI